MPIEFHVIINGTETVCFDFESLKENLTKVRSNITSCVMSVLVYAPFTREGPTHSCTTEDRKKAQLRVLTEETHHTREEAKCLKILQDVASLGGDEEHVQLLHWLVDIADALSLYKRVLLAYIMGVNKSYGVRQVIKDVPHPLSTPTSVDKLWECS